MCAYVERAAPRVWKGIRVPKSLGRIDDIHSIDADLISRVAELGGGHSFKAKLYDERNKRLYLGTIYFLIAKSEPLVDGYPLKRK